MRRAKVIRSLDFYGVKPWRCEHHADRSELFAYLDPRHGWERVGTIWAVRDQKARALADFIVKVINASARSDDVLREAHDVLVAMLTEGVTFSTEQEAERIVAGLGKLVA
jgi:hypothetical protein